MFKFAAIALAVSATGALAETIHVQGRDVEIARMSCSSGLPPAAAWGKCLVGSTFTGCSDPSTLCMKKNFRFAACRPAHRGIPSSWDNPRVILCEDDEHPASHSDDTHDDDEQDEQEHDEVTHDDSTETEPKDINDHEKDHDPEEGTNCLHSDLFDTVSGEQKCLCAGRHWRCADSNDKIAKACDVGLKCIRKNAFYAICAEPDGERANKVRDTCEWDMTEIPCGEHVGEYRKDLLLERGECPQ